MREYWRKFWRDKDGHIVIWQSPNPALWAWIIATALLFFIKTGALHNGLSFLGTAFIFTWAYLELLKGASPVRRLVGLVVLIATILPRFH